MELQFSLVRSVREVPRTEWDEVWRTDYPFVQYGYLLALEESGSVGGTSGWSPCYVIGRSQGVIFSILLLYEKQHSYGEYVFDWSWAEAYGRMGLNYYPKLVTAIPFTPSQGPRLGVRGDVDVVEPQVMNFLVDYLHFSGGSSWHGLFPCASQSERWEQGGFFQRLSCQYHWHNRGFSDMADYFDGFTSKRRKVINKERRTILDNGIVFKCYEGEALVDYHWSLFHHLYQLTYLKRSGTFGYLNQRFFELLGRYCSEQVLVIEAQQAGEVVGAALFLLSGDTLYGRYWGCLKNQEFLHFETCYYQGIEFAINRNLKSFDAGAQGEHKIQRGFIPVLTFSNHFILEERFSDVLRNHCLSEAAAVKRHVEDLQRFLPFKS
jgi:predicted N-acyltransferase